jgi:hypothetical protein
MTSDHLNKNFKSQIIFDWKVWNIIGNIFSRDIIIILRIFNLDVKWKIYEFSKLLHS